MLSENKIQLGAHEPKSLNAIDAGDFALIVALTNNSHDRLLHDGLDKVTEIEFWDVTDPSQIEGRRDQILGAYRIVRDDIEKRVLDRFGYLNEA